MKRLILLLMMMVVASACYGQNVMDYPTESAPALGDYIYLIKSGTTDRNTTKQQFQQNLFDSLGVVRAAMALQQIEIDDNNDSIVSNEARIEANESDITTNGVNISGNSVSIGTLQSDVSDLEDSIPQHRLEIDANLDSITIHRLLLDSLFDEIDLLWDTIEYYHPLVVTGQGTILWSEDFNDESVNASVSQSEMTTIIGAPVVIQNFDNDGDQQIFEYAIGDMAFSTEMDIGVTGGPGGSQFEKVLRSDAGAASNLNDLTELWMSYNVWFPDGFDNSAENADGKMFGGFRGSYEFYAYNPDNGWETYTDGFIWRKYYQDANPINGHRHLIYDPDMESDHGVKRGTYHSDWPTNSSSSTKLSTTPQNVAIRLILNTDESTSDGGYEVYINERVHFTEYGMRFRDSDTVFIDWALYGFFPNSSVAPTDNYLGVIDDIYLFTFSDGDSTLTGSDTIDASRNWTVDVPGWPKDEDPDGWGGF